MKRGQLIGLTGFATAGKDVAADALVTNEDYVKVGFADPLYDLAVWINPVIPVETEEYGLVEAKLANIVKKQGWTSAKRIPAVRQYLQELGTEGVRENLGEDTWVIACMNRVDKLLAEGTNVVITNCRFANEAMAVQSRDGLMVRINRPGTGAVNGHKSDQGEAFEFAQATVENTGSEEELGEKICAVAQSIDPQGGTPIDADAAVAHFEGMLDRCCTEAFKSIVAMASPSGADVEEQIRSNRVNIYSVVQDEDAEHYQVDYCGSNVGSITLQDGVLTSTYRVAK